MNNPTVSAASFSYAAEIHRRLLRHARRVDHGNVDAMMCLLTAVVVHGLFERAVFVGAPYVATEVRQSLQREHESFLEALGLMEELAAEGADRSDEAGDDLRDLCRAVHEKIVDHAERDERVIYGALARLDAFSAQNADQ